MHTIHKSVATYTFWRWPLCAIDSHPGWTLKTDSRLRFGSLASLIKGHSEDRFVSSHKDACEELDALDELVKRKASEREQPQKAEEYCYISLSVLRLTAAFYRVLERVAAMYATRRSGVNSLLEIRAIQAEEVHSTVRAILTSKKKLPTTTTAKKVTSRAPQYGTTSKAPTNTRTTTKTLKTPFPFAPTNAPNVEGSSALCKSDRTSWQCTSVLFDPSTNHHSAPRHSKASVQQT
ncbi:hypothetical protein OSTOST_08122 [Ostertagia ostertagi]